MLSKHLQDIFAHVHPDIQVIIVKVRIYLYLYNYIFICAFPLKYFNFKHIRFANQTMQKINNIGLNDNIEQACNDKTNFFYLNGTFVVKNVSLVLFLSNNHACMRMVYFSV